MSPGKPSFENPQLRRELSAAIKSEADCLAIDIMDCGLDSSGLRAALEEVIAKAKSSYYRDLDTEEETDK